MLSEIFSIQRSDVIIHNQLFFSPHEKDVDVCRYKALPPKKHFPTSIIKTILPSFSYQEGPYWIRLMVYPAQWFTSSFTDVQKKQHKQYILAFPNRDVTLCLKQAAALSQQLHFHISTIMCRPMTIISCHKQSKVVLNYIPGFMI